MTSIAQTISDELKRKRPLRALERYEEGLALPGGDALKDRFGDTMSRIAAARDITHDRARAQLPELYGGARREDRTRLLIAVIDRLFELEGDRDALQRFGLSLPSLVLDGTLQQQFCCKLAVRLGLADAIPQAVRSDVVLPLMRALIVVLRLGAPTTRDAAIEGLGALLKIVREPQAFPPDERLPIPRERGEKPDEYEKRVAISAEYVERLKRRRLLVMTIAGDPKALKEFEGRLQVDVPVVLDRLRREKAPVTKFEDVFYERQDLLRFLPGIARQGDDEELRRRTADLLRNAARLRFPDEREEITVAVARFQESVFRTIDTAMRRGWDWTEFDDVVAAAVRAIPRTMSGGAAVCNAQIRATVAILRTAVRLVTLSQGAAETRHAIAPLFENLHRATSPWVNHGIVEGCYRGLPQLAADPAYDDLTTPALRELIVQMGDFDPPDDLTKTHRRLVASSCFRRLLVSVTDTLLERQLLESEKEARVDKQNVDRDVRAVLQNPTPETVRGVCQRRTEGGTFAPATRSDHFDLAESVIATVAFETDLLGRTVSMFQRWEELPSVEQVLLTRILAAHLHAISRDAPELARHDVLRAAFLEAPGISRRDPTRLAWNVLSSIPAKAAEVADLEIQRFAEYRGRQSREDGGGGDDLPGYVLAMISPIASSRIAGAIAREMDLNLRHDREQPNADFTKSLYQVMLRGPHESIFDHLLPRVREESDRELVLLFRKHVAKVLHSNFDLKTILHHINDILPDLQGRKSETLRKLALALDLYRRLASDIEDVWPLLKDGAVAVLFRYLDELAKETPNDHRKPLMPLHERRLKHLQYEVTHYLSIPVDNFSSRTQALTRATDIAVDVEEAVGAHAGLQPPERILVVALMQQLGELFRRTNRWYCEQPLAQIDGEARDAKAKDKFWFFLCDPPSRARIDTAAALVRSGAGEANSMSEQHVDREIADLEKLIGKRPPEFVRQRGKFEEVFVAWRASNLDVDSLKKFLRKRWPPWFRVIYGLVTDFRLTSLLILLPCAWAVWMDLREAHWLEGLGFFAVSFAMIAAAILSFTRVVHLIAGWLRGRPDAESPGYWFESLLPRLARLTAVPMALIVEFDHSYEFPLVGSTWVLVLLMFLSFLTTRFFVTREIVDRKEKPGVFRLTGTEKKSVNQIVALALAHSFGIAVLLSAIFASSYEPTVKQKPHEPHPKIAAGRPAPFWELTARFLRRFDEVPKEHEHPRFLGLLPREVSMDFGTLAARMHIPLPEEVARHANFRFFPTIILSWTALGLFFGVFLEGFMKGERLRGVTPGEAATPA